MEGLLDLLDECAKENAATLLCRERGRVGRLHEDRPPELVSTNDWRLHVHDRQRTRREGRPPSALSRRPLGSNVSIRIGGCCILSKERPEFPSDAEPLIWFPSQWKAMNHPFRFFRFGPSNGRARLKSNAKNDCCPAVRCVALTTTNGLINTSSPRSTRQRSRR